MNITIHSITSRYEKFYRDAIEEYQKRLSRYCKIRIVTHKNIDALEKACIKGNPYIIVITPTGETISSEALAEKINLLAITGKSKIAMIIEEHDPPLESTNLELHEHLALSPMDMDIGLTMTILYEQIYRAFRIIKGEPYHK